jgi:adenine-specific DNA-methyltransferase
MLYPRLQLAKQLLSDDGVIFCSIDDKNQAYVKCLFDEVIGENNYIETFIWNKTSTPPALSNKSRKTHEFVLCYQNHVNSDKFVGLTNEGGDAPLLNESNKESILSFPANYVVTNMKNGIYKAEVKERVELLNDVEVKDGKIISQFSLKGKFRWQQSTLDKEINDNCLLIVKSEKFAIRYCREGERTVAPANYITEQVYSKDSTIDKKNQGVDTNEKAGKDLTEILGNKCFDFPKPHTLISYLLSFNKNPNSLVLDFFAGSGTTGHAVLDLNKQDGGNRTFILCQLNEKTETTPNGIAYDVTSKRLKRIMTGECYDGTKDFKWLEKNEPYGGNLDVYEIGSVSNFEWTEGKTPFDVIDETLYGKEKFATVREKIEWVCGNFDKTQKYLEKLNEE